MNLDNIDFRKYRRYLPFAIIFLLVILFSGIYLVHASGVPEEVGEIEITETTEKTETKEENIEEKILVDVKGAVVSPGVYQLSLGCSVQDAIHMAGGLLENSNTKVINLSKRVFDEMVIIVYTNEEIEAYQKDPEVLTEFVYVELPCECPDSMNDACINTETKVDENVSEESLVSINTATKEDLMTLSGIGESKAEAIIKYREENGEFLDITDIMNVSGIGESAFEKIKDSIAV